MRALRRRGRCDEADGPGLPARRVACRGSSASTPPERGAAGARAAAPSCAPAATRVLVCTGPVLLSQAVAAAERRGRRRGRLAARGCATSTARGWPRSPAARRSSCSTTTSSRGGQGDAVRAALPARGRRRSRASRACPACGTNDEVLRAHGLDAGSLAARLDAL